MTVYNTHVSQLQTFLSYEHPPVPFWPDKRGSAILKTIMPFMEQDTTWSNEAKPVHHLSPCLPQTCRTPLIYASQNGHSNVVEKLLAAGAQPDHQDNVCMVNLRFDIYTRHHKIIYHVTSTHLRIMLKK